MKNPPGSEGGVSELVGSILMIAVLVMAVSIAGIYLLSQPRPEKIPSLHATVWNDTQKIYISHDGGDPLEYNYIKIFVDGIDKTSSFYLSTATGQPWTTWSIGNVLVYVTGPSPVSTVHVVYTGTGSSAVGLATLYVGPVAGGGVAPNPVTASFSGSPVSGRVPLGVQFTDASTGPVISWLWLFGDGGTSTEQNPLHTYSTPSTYTVTLTVHNGTGTSTVTKTNYILVKPQVCFADNFNDNSVGSAWTFVGGTWEESGGVMKQTSIASADPKKAIISNTGLDFTSDLTITSKVRIDSWIDGDMARGGVSLFTNTADGNGYNLLFHNDHNTVQFLDDKVAWQTPAYSFAWSDNNWYWFKMNMTSGTLWGKIWQDGTPEPSNWQYSYTPAARTGTVYPALNGGSADATVYSMDSFDDVLVCAN